MAYVSLPLSCLSNVMCPSPECVPSRQMLARPAGARTKKKKRAVPWAEISRCSGKELENFVELSCLPSGLKRLMDPCLALWEEEVLPLVLHIVKGEVGLLEDDREPFCWLG
jgi:hypothetical protein